MSSCKPLNIPNKISVYFRDTRRCFRYLAFLGSHNHFVFIGDSRIRQLYESFLSQLEVRGHMTQPKDHPHTDLSFGDAQLRLRVQFIWSPVVSRHMVDKFNEWKVCEIKKLKKPKKHKLLSP